MQHLPPSVDELIDELDKAYPEYLPKPGDTLEQIHDRAGARGLVLLLKTLRDRKNSSDKPKVRQRNR